MSKATQAVRTASKAQVAAAQALGLASHNAIYMGTLPAMPKHNAAQASAVTAYCSANLSTVGSAGQVQAGPLLQNVPLAIGAVQNPVVGPARLQGGKQAYAFAAHIIARAYCQAHGVSYGPLQAALFAAGGIGTKAAAGAGNIANSVGEVTRAYPAFVASANAQAKKGQPSAAKVQQCMLWAVAVLGHITAKVPATRKAQPTAAKPKGKGKAAK